MTTLQSREDALLRRVKGLLIGPGLKMVLCRNSALYAAGARLCMV